MQKLEDAFVCDVQAEIELFNRVLATKESGGRYQYKNEIGHVGLYQVGPGRLSDYNRISKTRYTMDDLSKSLVLQEKVHAWHIEDIDAYIDETGLAKFLGQQFEGVRLSRNSFRAVAHLGGKNGLRKFLTSKGDYNPADCYGTHLSEYAVEFANISGATGPDAWRSPRDLEIVARYLKDGDDLKALSHPKEGQDWASRDSKLGRHLPIGERSGLKFRVDGQTSAQSLTEIIDWLDVDNSIRYQPDGDDTFCNVYACDFCYLSGAYLPRVWWRADDPFSEAEPKGPDIIELTANALYEWLTVFGARFGWQQAADLTELQTAANNGNSALIVAQSPPERHGHIAIVCPETMSGSATWCDGKVAIPRQSQTKLRDDQGKGDLRWWLDPQFSAYGYWFHDRRTKRPAKLKPAWWISSVTSSFFPHDCTFLDAKLSIYQNEVAGMQQLPAIFIDALVAGEDKRFFRHPGFDAIAILRAISRFVLRRKIEGASTIEQQLIRTITGKRERTLRRKLGEILLAMRYSSALDKRTIASIYLENAYFGWRASGYRNALKRPEFIRETDLETAAWLAASLRYPIASCESDRRRLLRQNRANFIIKRLEKGRQVVKRRIGE